MTHRSAKIGAVALACACGTALANSTVVPSGQTLEGLPDLACETILCLSSSLQPAECAPSLNHYFGIQIFKKYGLDWGATVAARRALACARQPTRRICLPGLTRLPMVLANATPRV